MFFDWTRWKLNAYIFWHRLQQQQRIAENQIWRQRFIKTRTRFSLLLFVNKFISLLQHNYQYILNVILNSTMAYYNHLTDPNDLRLQRNFEHTKANLVYGGWKKTPEIPGIYSQNELLFSFSHLVEIFLNDTWSSKSIIYTGVIA